jgi:hypothetical protein
MHSPDKYEGAHFIKMLANVEWSINALRALSKCGNEHGGTYPHIYYPKYGYSVA